MPELGDGHGDGHGAVIHSSPKNCITQSFLASSLQKVLQLETVRHKPTSRLSSGCPRGDERLSCRRARAGVGLGFRV